MFCLNAFDRLRNAQRWSEEGSDLDDVHTKYQHFISSIDLLHAGRSNIEEKPEKKNPVTSSGTSKLTSVASKRFPSVESENVLIDGIGNLEQFGSLNNNMREVKEAK
jgi:hypothetical protein